MTSTNQGAGARTSTTTGAAAGTTSSSATTGASGRRGIVVPQWDFTYRGGGGGGGGDGRSGSSSGKQVGLAWVGKALLPLGHRQLFRRCLAIALAPTIAGYSAAWSNGAILGAPTPSAASSGSTSTATEQSPEEALRIRTTEELEAILKALVSGEVEASNKELTADCPGWEGKLIVNRFLLLKRLSPADTVNLWNILFSRPASVRATLSALSRLYFVDLGMSGQSSSTWAPLAILVLNKLSAYQEGPTYLPSYIIPPARRSLPSPSASSSSTSSTPSSTQPEEQTNPPTSESLTQAQMELQLESKGQLVTPSSGQSEVSSAKLHDQEPPRIDLVETLADIDAKSTFQRDRDLMSKLKKQLQAREGKASRGSEGEESDPTGSGDAKQESAKEESPRLAAWQSTAREEPREDIKAFDADTFWQASERWLHDLFRLARRGVLMTKLVHLRHDEYVLSARSTVAYKSVDELEAESEEDPTIPAQLESSQLENIGHWLWSPDLVLPPNRRKMLGGSGLIKNWRAIGDGHINFGSGGLCEGKHAHTLVAICEALRRDGDALKQPTLQAAFQSPRQEMGSSISSASSSSSSSSSPSNVRRPSVPKTTPGDLRHLSGLANERAVGSRLTMPYFLPTFVTAHFLGEYLLSWVLLVMSWTDKQPKKKSLDASTADLAALLAKGFSSAVAAFTERDPASVSTFVQQMVDWRMVAKQILVFQTPTLELNSDFSSSGSCNCIIDYLERHHHNKLLAVLPAVFGRFSCDVGGYAHERPLVRVRYLAEIEKEGDLDDDDHEAHRQAKGMLNPGNWRLGKGWGEDLGSTFGQMPLKGLEEALHLVVPLMLALAASPSPSPSAGPSTTSSSS